MITPVTDNKESMMDSQQAVTLRCDTCGDAIPPADAVLRYSTMFTGADIGYFFSDHLCLPCADHFGNRLTESSRPCEQCARAVFYVAGEQHLRVLCSKRCENQFYRQKRRRRWAMLQNIRPPICATCKQPFNPARRDQKHCTAACRQRAYRQKKRLGQTLSRRRSVRLRANTSEKFSRFES